MNSTKLAVIVGCLLAVSAGCLLVNADPYHALAVLGFVFALDVQIVQAVKSTLEKERQKQAEEFLKNLEVKLSNKDENDVEKT